MTYKPTGPSEVRPNTLQGQSAPNTFRGQGGPGTVGNQELNSGGGNAGPSRLAARRGALILVWVTIAMLAIAFVVALYLLIELS